MFSNLSLMFKLNVVAIIFGEIWQLRECSSGAILLVFVDNRANFPIHTQKRGVPSAPPEFQKFAYQIYFGRTIGVLT